MNKLFFLLVVFSLSLLWGCKTVSVSEPQAAVLISPDADTMLELTKTVSQAMDGKSVKLDPGVFTQSNELVMVQNDPETLDGQLSGRIMTRPQTFHLMLRGSECYLLHKESQTEFMLNTSQCRPQNN